MFNRHFFRFFFYFQIFAFVLSGSALLAESFVSIHGYPQYSQKVEDYQLQTQTTPILNQTIDKILYPVFGFPAMVTPSDAEFSFIFRSSTPPTIEFIKITREIGEKTREFLTLEPLSIEIVGANLYRVACRVPAILPSIRYDLSVKLVDENEVFVSKNSIFFPEDEDLNSMRFLIWADPQIEDLQSKNPMKEFNYNSKEYPFYSNNVLDYSQQEGIIKSTISQMNSTGYQFVTMLGDLVFGIGYQSEYEHFLTLAQNLEIPFFPIPGNHDGYAKFVEEKNLASPLEWDGLEYWVKFIGPLNYAFKFNDRIFLMINSYDGSPQRRAAGKPLGVGKFAAVPVTNWGGFVTEPSLNWIGTMTELGDVFAIFSHMLALGKDAQGIYTEMVPYPGEYLDSFGVSVQGSQEWNIETASWDSDPTDSILNETATSNTGTKLVSYMTKQSEPPIYFSGHTHRDHVYVFDKGSELVKGSGVFANEKMDFVMTTTGATSGKTYWGFRKVDVDGSDVSYSYTCDRFVQCSPNPDKKKEEEEMGFQSIPAGNMWVSYKWTLGETEEESFFIGGDGKTEKIEVEITNYLPTEEAVFLRFILPAGKNYQLDDDDFKITNAVVSRDLSVAILTASGKIGAGSTMEDFYDKKFTPVSKRLVISAVEPLLEEPILEYSSSIVEDEPITASVVNGDKFKTLIWKRNDVDFASGDSFSVRFEDYQPVETISLLYVAEGGACGTTEFVVDVTLLEEPDDDVPADSGDSADDSGSTGGDTGDSAGDIAEDAENVDDYDGDSEVADDDYNEDSKEVKNKKSGCALIIL